MKKTQETKKLYFELLNLEKTTNKVSGVLFFVNIIGCGTHCDETAPNYFNLVRENKHLNTSNNYTKFKPNRCNDIYDIL